MNSRNKLPIWWEEMPRSIKTPSTNPLAASLLPRIAEVMSRKLVRTNSSCPFSIYNESLRDVSAIASGSWSRPITFPEASKLKAMTRPCVYVYVCWLCAVLLPFLLAQEFLQCAHHHQQCNQQTHHSSRWLLTLGNYSIHLSWQECGNHILLMWLSISVLATMEHILILRFDYRKISSAQEERARLQQ